MDMSGTSALKSPIKRKFSYLEERERINGLPHTIHMRANLCIMRVVRIIHFLFLTFISLKNPSLFESSVLINLDDILSLT